MFQDPLYLGEIRTLGALGDVSSDLQGELARIRETADRGRIDQAIKLLNDAHTYYVNEYMRLAPDRVGEVDAYVSQTRAYVESVRSGSDARLQNTLTRENSLQKNNLEKAAQDKLTNDQERCALRLAKLSSLGYGAYADSVPGFCSIVNFLEDNWQVLAAGLAALVLVPVAVGVSRRSRRRKNPRRRRT